MNEGVAPPNAYGRPIDVGSAPVVVQQHLHAAAPLILTERTADRMGLSARALRKLARQGLAHVRTVDGVTVLVADLEAYLRERSIVVASTSSADAEPDGDVAALERAGLRFTGAGR